MKQTFLCISISAALLCAGSIAEAKRKSKKDSPTPIDKSIAAPPLAPPAPIVTSPPSVPTSSAAVGVQVTTEGTLPPPPPPLPPPGLQPQAPPQRVVAYRRPFWELAAAGGGVIGGAYVLSVLVGAFSYAGFYDGQWGWFVPLAGPALAMAGVGGEPAGCLSKAAYTYSLGPILTLIYVGGIATAIAGAVAKKDVMRPAGTAPAAPPAPALQVAPSVGPGSAGMILLGTF